MKPLLQRYVACANDSDRINVLYNIQNLKLNEFDQVGQRLDGLGAMFSERFFKHFTITDSQQLKLESLRFMRSYIQNIGYDHSFDHFISSKCLLKVNLNRYLQREVLKILQLMIRQVGLTSSEINNYLKEMLFKYLESIKFVQETYQLELVDLISFILLEISLLPEKMDLPDQLIELKLKSVQNLIFVQNEIQQRYKIFTHISQVESDFELFLFIQSKIPENQLDETVNKMIAMYKDYDRVKDHVTYQLNIYLAILMFSQLQNFSNIKLVNFICEKFFLYQNINQLYLERTQSENLFKMNHLQTLNGQDTLLFLLETKMVNIPPSFIRELLFCTKFSGNFQLLVLAHDIMRMAENKTEIVEEFQVNQWASLVTEIQQKHDQQGIWTQTVEDLLWVTRENE
ncbi:Conserved_hypothetical protein [Hexamita inflata]|uniref:Uncharacterized protein n=1 Tax=Hexamita inflata TaxID=28002 RepID=A0AA86TXN1_9EUKA|nr:Conserved hypothetical protein [Hexamita inflata]